MSQDRTLTYLIVPSGATALRAELADLSANGLIHATAVVGDDMSVEMLTGGTYEPSDVEGAYSGRALDLIRVVAVRLNAGPTAEQRDAERRIVNRLRERGEPVGIEFKTFTVSVISIDHSFVASMFHDTWTSNVAVIPEEAAGGIGYMPVDLSAANVESVALAAATLVGGLWTWMDRGILDDERAVNVGGRSYVRLTRLALRIVDAGDLSSRMIGWAMDPGGVWPIPKDYVAHDQPDEAIAALAEATADSPECQFSFVAYVPQPRPKRKRVSLFAAIKLFYSRMWAHIRGVPGQALAGLRDRVETGIERFAQSHTFGADSAIVVRIGQRPANATELSDGLNRIALLAHLREVTVPAPLPTPDTWRVVRSVALGSSDGGDFAGTLKGQEPRWQGERAVIGERHLIAPDPGEPGNTLAFAIEPHELHAIELPAQSEAHLRAFDVMSVHLFRDALETAERAATDELDTEVHTDENDTGEDDDESGVGPLHHDVDPLEQTKSFVIASLRDRFDAWMAPRAHTLLWQLGVRLTSGVTAALADFDAASEAFERVQAEHEAQDKEWAVLRRKLRRRTIFATIVLALFLLAAAASAVFVALSVALLIAAAAVCVALLFPVLFYRTEKRLIQLEFKLRELETLPQRIVNQRHHDVHEIARLTYLNDQLIDWGEIISMIVHRPWGRKATNLGAEPWQAHSGSQVFTAGIPTIDEIALQGEILLLRKHLARVGWLTAVYNQAFAAWELRYAALTSAVAGVGTDPSSDPGTNRPIDTMHGSGTPIYRPRQQLKTDLIDDRFADELRRERVGALRRVIDSRHTSTVLGPVQCAVEDLNWLRPADFLRPIVDQTPIPNFTRFIHNTVGGPSRAAEFVVVGASRSLDETNSVDPTPRRHLDVGGVAHRFVLATVRADFSTPIELAAIVGSAVEPPDAGPNVNHPFNEPDDGVG